MAIKKKLVVSYDNLPPGVREQIAIQYPEGWANFILKVKGPRDIFFHAILVETDEVSYLVKVRVKKDRKGLDDEEILPEQEETSESESQPDASDEQYGNNGDE